LTAEAKSPTNTAIEISALRSSLSPDVSERENSLEDALAEDCKQINK